MKRLLFWLFGLLATFCEASPYVTNVVARQRFPWNGLVDVSYEVVGSTNGIEYAYGHIAAKDRVSGRVLNALSLDNKLDINPGRHSAVWNLMEDATVVSTDVVISVSIKTPSKYRVIDLSPGPYADWYPVEERDDEPVLGWTDEYKTTKLVLRLVPAGSYQEYSTTYTVSRPYYLGIFEVTQAQYDLVVNDDIVRDLTGVKPVDMVSYSQIRGSDVGAQWPASDAVDDNSFMGLLRKRTGLMFDLPTRAQWIRACVASVGSTTAAYSCYGEHWTDNVLHPVGMLPANDFGFYDMLGNVKEWCLNWSGTDSDYRLVDPVGAQTGSYRIVCGGKTSSSAAYCSPQARNTGEPYMLMSGVGFRLALWMNEL